MSLLHDYFNTRNLPSFQRLLESSGSKVDVNCRDWLGRTVLHLASVSYERLDYLRALLKHPAINLNLPDSESHWTSLHRALYNANLPAARLLLQRSDVDLTLKDSEGYTAFDLYNATVIGIKHTGDWSDGYADLYTWGTNIYAGLGLGGSNDRVHPEQVSFQNRDDGTELQEQTLLARFLPIRVKQVEMSKLHTAVITSESGGNIRVCGFGSGGRLGPNSYTQYDMKPLSQFTQTVVSIALGQDHTLALTRNGEVLSWGLNRFSQLGYPVEQTTQGRVEEPIQYIPRKVQGPLKKEFVKGIAASKCASACWTEDSVYTWGTNNGQLGYDRVAQPVQVQPRKVSRITSPVLSICMTENVMACLMQNRQVECFYNDGHHRINFPAHAFPSPMRPYRPPQAIKDSRMAKITCCGDVFATLSHLGEVYIFSPSSTADPDARSRFKCQRVWALRKKASAVKDVALGADGSIIICTESGHVFIRSRTVKASQAGKTFKFQRMPTLQRITHVCASSSGAFSALRVDFKPQPIEISGNMIWQDLSQIQSFLHLHMDEKDNVRPEWKGRSWELEEEPLNAGVDLTNQPISDDDDRDADNEDGDIENDIIILKEMLDVLKKEEDMRKNGIKLEDKQLSHGADTLVQFPSGAVFPVHGLILAARSEVLCDILSTTNKKGSSVKDELQNIRIATMTPLFRVNTVPGPGAKQLARILFEGCQPLSVLMFLHYLYSDNSLALWDRRVFLSVEPYAVQRKVKLDVTQIKAELQGLGRVFQLQELLKVLERPVKIIPIPTMVRDMTKLFNMVQSSTKKIPLPLVPDVILELEDRDVCVHSVILRARSELFQSFFDESVWTRCRWDEDGVVRVDLKHMKWDVVEFVLRFVCCGMDEELFEKLEFVRSVDEVLEFMFEVMAVANELLLDRLVLLCSSVIITFSNIHNACYVLEYATYYHAEQLIDRIQSYITANMELFLETRMLDELPQELVIQLAKYAMMKQEQKAPFVRSGVFEREAMMKYEQWLELQDVPVYFVRSNKTWVGKKNGLVIPKFDKNKDRDKDKVGCGFGNIQKDEGVLVKNLRRPPSGDDIFTMDDTDLTGSGSVVSHSTGNQGAVWKAHVTPKVDMKTVMAEAAASQTKPNPHPPLISRTKSNQLLRAPSKGQQQWVPLSPSTPPQGTKIPTGSGSPWKTTPIQPVDVFSIGSGSGSEQYSKESVNLQSSNNQKPQVQARASSQIPVSQGQGQGQVTPVKMKVSTPSASNSSTTPVIPSSGLMMGPTITPTRMSASGSKSNIGQRNVSGGGKVWSRNHPIESIPPPLLSSSPLQSINTTTNSIAANTMNGNGSRNENGKDPMSMNSSNSNPNTNTNTGGISFVAIQHLQQEERQQFQTDPLKDKRSILEIQEEEKQRIREEEFLRWWQEEEARVKFEMEALEQFQNRSEVVGSGKQKQHVRRSGKTNRGGGGNTGDKRDKQERKGGGEKRDSQKEKEGREKGENLNYPNLQQGRNGNTNDSNQPRPSASGSGSTSTSTANNKSNVSNRNNNRRRRPTQKANPSPAATATPPVA